MTRAEQERLDRIEAKLDHVLLKLAGERGPVRREGPADEINTALYPVDRGAFREQLKNVVRRRRNNAARGAE